MKTGRHAFTLIETLAVLTLIGLSSIMLTPLLLGATDDAKIDAAMRRVLDMDAQARLIAQREHGASVQCADGVCLIQVLHDSESQNITSWDHGIEIGLVFESPNGDRLDRIEYDAAGRSSDFAVSVAHDGLRRSITVAGLTGWTEPGGHR
jgi:prepilin-type N-terminal cleavage/methylation domain-containing protein